MKRGSWAYNSLCYSYPSIFHLLQSSMLMALLVVTLNNKTAIKRIIYFISITDFIFAKVYLHRLFIYFEQNWSILTLSFPAFWRPTKSRGGGSRSPPYENDEGVLLEPYSQKTLWKGTKFRIVWKKIGSKSQKLAEILRFWKIGPKLANF